MSIENQKSQEQNQEFDAWVKAKESISQKNAIDLANDLKDIDTPNAMLIKQLEDKLNFWDASKAWPTDKLKWTAFENSLEWKNKSEVINLIIKLWLVTVEDLKNLNPDQATKKIQKIMFDKIYLDPQANDKLQKFLKAKWLPNDWLLDGKFGARTLFALSIIIDIPPTIVPEKPKDTPPEKVEEKIITYEPKYTINVRWDAADGAYFFVDTEDQYQNFVKQYPTIFSSAVIQAKSNTIEQEHLWVTINSTKNGFEENIKDYGNSSDVLWPFKRIGDSQEKQQVLRAAGKLRRDDFGNMVADKVDNRHIFKHEKSKQYTIVRAQ